MPTGMRSLRRKLLLQSRLATANYRALPDFIIIGSQKCGTTSLFHYLGQHPQIAASFGKEVHYFDGGLEPSVDNFQKGKRWYQANFPLKKAIQPGHKAFEASPLYIFHPLAPRRIHDLIPRVKLIALLRNPTERAISHYFHTKRRGKEDLPLFEALKRERDRLEPVMKSGDYKCDAFIHQSYQSRGLYLMQLKRYLEYFSRDQILIMSSEEFFASPTACLRTVFEFVGVDPLFGIEDLAARNVGGNKQQVDARAHEYLDAFFKPHNEALYQFVGRDYGW